MALRSASACRSGIRLRPTARGQRLRICRRPSVNVVKILAAEDAPDEARALIDFLRAQGYTAIVASDGEETVIKARVEHPDLLLLDIRLPVYDGFEVCQRLKS